MKAYRIYHKDPDGAEFVYKMYAAREKAAGRKPKPASEMLKFSEYFTVTLHADGTWTLEPR